MADLLFSRSKEELLCVRVRMCVCVMDGREGSGLQSQNRNPSLVKRDPYMLCLSVLNSKKVCAVYYKQRVHDYNLCIYSAGMGNVMVGFLWTPPPF